MLKTILNIECCNSQQPRSFQLGFAEAYNLFGGGWLAKHAAYSTIGLHVGACDLEAFSSILSA